MIDKIIVLIGPPGSGKGFYASWMRKQYSLEYISSGDIARLLISKNKQNNVYIDKIVNAGNLLDAKFISKLIQNKINKMKNNFILDGFPRNLEQFTFFQKMINSDQQKIYYLILNCNLKTCFERINNRLICPKCSTIYNQKTNKPKQFNQCDEDQTLLIQRQDTNKIKRRFIVFKKETQPLIQFLKTSSLKSFHVIELDTNLKNEINFQFLKRKLF